MKRHTTISFQGTHEEVTALRIHAIRRRVTVGELVREALLAHYPVFFESDGTKKYQSVSKSSTQKKKSRK